MKVNREKFLHALEMCAPGLSPRDVIQQSSCFAFKDKYVHTFNEEVAVRYKSPVDIVGAVRAEPLIGILQKLTEETIEVTQDEAELKIKGKRRECGITMESEIQLPLEHLESPGKFSPLPERFVDAIGLVQECVSTDDGKWHLTCIHIHPKWVESFDEYQFARFNLKTGVSSSILVKQQALQHIIPSGMNEFSQTDSFIHFRNPNKLVLSCRLYVDEYPSMKMMVDEAHGDRIKLPKSLMEATDRAELFSSSNSGDDQIRVDLKPGHCQLQGDGQFGWYKEGRKATYGGRPFSFKVKPNMLRQLVQRYHQNGCEVSEKAFRAGNEEFIYVTTLAEVKDEKKKKTVKKKKKAKVA